MRYRDPTVDELLPSEEELRRQKRAAAAPGEDSAWGGGLGGLIGGGLGLGASALLGLGTGGAGLALAPELIGGGASIGAGLGSAIGGSVGGAQANDDNAFLDEAELKRQKRIQEMQLRNEALDQLEQMK